MVIGHLAEQVFTLFSWFLALAWIWKAATALRGMATLPDLTRLDPADMPILPAGDDPQLTVVVPACNEEGSIHATLRSLLASRGIRLQIIAVDDRSADRTGELMEEVAGHALDSGSQHSLQVIHLKELPAGWLGKPHAMARAAQLAASPWLLFTDGDVLFQPRALEVALRDALAEGADHLVLAPTLLLETPAEAAIYGVFLTAGLWVSRLWKVADPRTRDFVGAGAFNLVRRAVYEQLGGFEALRMEVVEDARLGWMVKRAGFRQRVAVGPGLVSLRWIHGAFGIVGNLEKNGFASFRYRIGLSLLACFGLAVQAVWPLVALAAGGRRWPGCSFTFALFSFTQPAVA